MNETDEALVRKAQRGDQRAFEELIRRTGRLLYSRLFLDTGSVHQTEDLVQETLLIAWRSIGQVTDPVGFRSWLLRLAKTVTIDANRRNTRKKRAGIRTSLESADDVADRSTSPLLQAEQAESRRQVLAQLRALPEEYRQPLTLRYIAGADYETISRQLNLTNGSLRGLLIRGMAMLREQMQERQHAGKEKTP